MKRKYIIKASFTVEASFIVTVVIMAVFMCTYYGFVLHDKAVLEEISWQTAQKAILQAVENSDMEDGTFCWDELQKKGLLWRFASDIEDAEKVKQIVIKDAQKEMFVSDISILDVNMDARSVVISYTANVRLPMLSIITKWGVEFCISGSVVVSETEQEEFVRLVRGIRADNYK